MRSLPSEVAPNAAIKQREINVCDAQAESRWERLNVALDYYTRYLGEKSSADRFSLSVLDLLFVRNFKAGNSSITESLAELGEKLPKYESALSAIGRAFPARRLRDVKRQCLLDLIVLADKTIRLALDPQTSISGFGPSYTSALLAAHFPQLLPVLDRRVLNGAGISVKLNSQNQVIDIENYYKPLIQVAHRTLQGEPTLSLRELDRRWFVVPTD